MDVGIDPATGKRKTTTAKRTRQLVKQANLCIFSVNVEKPLAGLFF